MASRLCDEAQEAEGRSGLHRSWRRSATWTGERNPAISSTCTDIFFVHLVFLAIHSDFASAPARARPSLLLIVLRGVVRLDQQTGWSSRGDREHRRFVKLRRGPRAPALTLPSTSSFALRSPSFPAATITMVYSSQRRRGRCRRGCAALRNRRSERPRTAIACDREEAASSGSLGSPQRTIPG